MDKEFTLSLRYGDREVTKKIGYKKNINFSPSLNMVDLEFELTKMLVKQIKENIDCQLIRELLNEINRQ